MYKNLRILKISELSVEFGLRIELELGQSLDPQSPFGSNTEGVYCVAANVFLFIDPYKFSPLTPLSLSCASMTAGKLYAVWTIDTFESETA